VITRLIDFGSVGNVGHINTINIRVAKVTIKPQAIKRVDQSLAMEHPNDVPLMHAPKNPQVSNDELCGPQHPQHNINNMFYTTPTNDGDIGMSRIIPIESQARKSNLDITPFKTYLDRGSRGSIQISPRIVATLTSINRSSGRRGAPMGPPPPSGLNEVTTTQS
jgi:hypothetical protein